MNPGMPVATAMRIRRALASPSGEAVSWLKKRSRKWRTSSANWLRLGARTGPRAAWALSESASGSDIMNRRWNSSPMANLHDLHHLLRNGPRVLLLDQLRKDAFKIGQAHQLRKIGGAGIGQDPALGDNDHAIADLLDNFKHMGDVEDSLALRREQLQEVSE